MKSLIRATALMLLILVSPLARAGSIAFTLHDVNLSFYGLDGGTLTGSFTTNEAMTEVLSLDLKTEARDFGAWKFAATTYDDAQLSGAVVNSSPGLLEVVIDQGGDETHKLRLSFDGGLKALGVTSILASVSAETQHAAGGNRYVTSGYVAAAAVPPAPGAVPEPSSIVMAAVALGAAGLFVRRRRAG